MILVLVHYHVFETGAAVVAVDQLYLIGAIIDLFQSLVDDLHGLITEQAVEVDVIIGLLIAVLPLQFRILCRTSYGKFNRILGLVLVHLGINDLVFIQTKFIEHVAAIYQHIS